MSKSQKKTKSKPPANEYYKLNADTSTKRLVLERQVWHKMSGWCKAANCEVSGLGLIRDDGSHYTVYDVFLPPQYGATGFTELDQDGIAQLMMDINRKSPERLKDLKYWWHTHYNFGTFWSGTDEEMARIMAIKSKSWAVSTVINQRDDALTRIDIVDPTGICIDLVDIAVDGGVKSDKHAFKRDVDRMVKPMSQNPNKCSRLKDEVGQVKRLEAPRQQPTGWDWRQHVGGSELKDFDKFLRDWRRQQQVELNSDEPDPKEIEASKKPPEMLPASILTGFEVMKTLDIKPGPDVGAAIKSLRYAQKSGLIFTVGDAYRWLPEWYASYKKVKAPPEQRDLFKEYDKPAPSFTGNFVNYAGKIMTLSEYYEAIKGGGND